MKAAWGYVEGREIPRRARTRTPLVCAFSVQDERLYARHPCHLAVEAIKPTSKGEAWENVHAALNLRLFSVTRTSLFAGAASET